MSTNKEALEQDKEEIYRLYVRGYISETVKKQAYKKLEKAVSELEAYENLDKVVSKFGVTK